MTSFANASGGDILYGVKEKRDENGKTTGTPEIAEGLKEINPDQEILRLENILRDCVKPRIPSVQFHKVEGFSQGPVIVLRISKSWSSPHMVTFNNSSRFYSRTNSGKYQLDVDGIRSAFALSESIGEKIKCFRDERVGRIIAGETPIVMKNQRKVVLHVFPIESADSLVKIDIQRSYEEIKKYSPINSYAQGFRYNFDGVLISDKGHNGWDSSYLQVYRNRTLEAVTTSLLGGNDSESTEERKYIPVEMFEQEVISSLEEYFKLFENLNANPPFVLMLTLIGVKGLILWVSQNWRHHQNPIDRDLLILPDILLEDFNGDAQKILQPLFDMVWQACGWERSMNFNENGKWVGSR